MADMVDVREVGSGLLSHQLSIMCACGDLLDKINGIHVA